MQTTTAVKWQDSLKFGENGPNPQTLVENERVRVMIAGLKAGQRIPVHPENAAVYNFIEGYGAMIVDGNEYPIEPGRVIFVPEGASRGMRADEQIVFLAIRLAAPASK